MAAFSPAMASNVAPRISVCSRLKDVITATSAGTVKTSERKLLMDAYRDSINGYTYYERHSG